MSTIVKRFAEISKFEKSEDGKTLQVFGVASTESVDAAGEVITKGAMTDAIPDFLAHGTGALRAMHQPIAAGFVTKVTVNEAGETEIEATVTDPVEIHKVETGTYKGFSVGGKKLPGGYDAKTKTISKMRLTEISLVDRPCNPEAVITMFKGEDIEVVVSPESAAAVDELAKLLDAGSVTPERLVELVKAELGEGIGGAAPAEPVAKADAPAAKKDDTKADDEKTEGKEADKKKKKGNPFAKFDENGAIEKGMYHVSRLAELLESIGYLVSGVEYELEWEKDGSTVPAQLRAWLTAGADVFEALAAEEVAEFVAAYKPAPAADVVELSEKATTLRKSLTEAAGVSLIDYLTVAKGLMPENDIAKAVLADGFDKTTDVLVGALSPDVAKLDAANDTISKLTTELDVVKAELTALKAAPAPSAARLRVVVEKSMDVPVDDTSKKVDEPIKKADGTIDAEATAKQEIMKLHQSGGQPLRSFIK